MPDVRKDGDLNRLQLMEQIETGDRTIHQLVGEEIYGMMTFSTRMKLLFSMIQSESIVYDELVDEKDQLHGERFVENITRKLNEVAIIGASGLMMRNTLYPFTHEYQDLYHRNLIYTLMKDSVDSKEGIGKIVALFDSWKESYIKRAAPRIEKIVNRQRLPAVKEIKKRFEAPFLGQTPLRYHRSYIRSEYPTVTEKQGKEISKAVTSHRQRCNMMAYDVKNKRRDEYREEFALVEKGSWEEAQLIDRIRADVHDEIMELTISLERSLSERYQIEFRYEKFEETTHKLFIDAFERHLIRNRLMTKKEITAYHTFTDRCNEIGDMIIDRNLQLLNETGIKVQIARDDKSYLSAQLLPIRHTRGQAGSHKQRVRDLFAELRIALKSEAGNGYNQPKEYRRLLAHHWDTNEREGKKRDTLDQLKVRFIRLSDLLLREEGSKESLRLYEEYTDLCRDYYNNLYVKYQEELNLWGLISSMEQTRMNRAIRAYHDDFDLKLPELTRQRSIEELNLIIEKILPSFTETSVPAQNVLLLPTGFLIAIDEKTAPLIVGFSPIDERIREQLTDKQWREWQTAWSSFYSENIRNFDRATRLLVNEEIEALLEAEEELLTPGEQRLRRLQKRYGFKIPSLLEPHNGRIRQPINDTGIDALEEVLPSYGSYLKGISGDPSDISAKELVEIIRNYAGGESRKPSELLYDFVLNTSVLENLFREASFEELQPYLSSCFAIDLYNVLDREQLNHFNQLVEEKLSISKMDFFRFSNKRIDSPFERRVYMSRVVFIMEFVKYIAGKQTEELLEFFKRLKG